MSLKKLLLVCVIALHAHAAHRRALLVGIDDYTASHIPPHASPVPGRDYTNLGGSVNDVTSMRDVVARLGFDDVVTLTDQAATRAAILDAIETRLIAPSQKDDVVFFFYAGH